MNKCVSFIQAALDASQRNDEARISKSETSTDDQNYKPLVIRLTTTAFFEHSCFGLCFDIRYSDFGFRIFALMALRDIFKFRELPDSETSKPFLEHLEDLRWTIVKMAITLVVAMIICFAFRSILVRLMQAPLRDVGSQVGALKALGITDSIVISFH